MKNCVVIIFSWHKLEKMSEKNFGSLLTEAKQCKGKVSCSYQTDLLLSNSSAYAIEENIEE